MPINEIARKEVVTAGPETPVSEVASRMKEKNVGTVVVTNADRVVGIITDRDIAVRVAAEEKDSAKLDANEAMSTDVEVARPTDTFAKVARTMSREGVRRLPVCDVDDRLRGMITADDMTEMLAELAEQQQQIGNVIKAQRPSHSSKDR
jgi:CBS domain-containing protein